MQTATGPTWAWALTSLEPVSGRNRQEWGRQLERDRRKRSTRELIEAGGGFLRGNEVPVTRSGQAESVKPCVLEGVSNALPEVGSMGEVAS